MASASAPVGAVPDVVDLEHPGQGLDVVRVAVEVVTIPARVTPSSSSSSRSASLAASTSRASLVSGSRAAGRRTVGAVGLVTSRGPPACSGAAEAHPGRRGRGRTGSSLASCGMSGVRGHCCLSVHAMCGRGRASPNRGRNLSVTDRLVIRGAHPGTASRTSTWSCPQRPDRVHGPVRVGQVLARFDTIYAEGQHCSTSVAVGLRPPVLGLMEEAGRRLHRGAVAGHLDRPGSQPPEPPLHRRHDHRGSTTTCGCCTPASASPTARCAALHLPPDPRPDRRPDPGAAVGHPLPAAGAVVQGRKGEYEALLRSFSSQGFRPGRVDGKVRDLSGRSGWPRPGPRHRDRGPTASSPAAPRPTRRPPPPGRLGRDGRRPGRGAGRPGRAGRRGRGCSSPPAPGLPLRQPVVRGAGAAQLLASTPPTRPARTAPAWGSRRCFPSWSSPTRACP